MFVCLFVCSVVCLFLRLFGCLFVCLSVCLSVCLFVCLFVCISITIHFSISSLWHLTLPNPLLGDKVPPHMKVEHIAGNQLFMLLQVVACWRVEKLCRVAVVSL